VACRRWRQAPQCPIGALESPGVYWKPVSHGLSEAVAVHVANSRDGRQRPGKKPAQRDAPWIAALLAPGLLTPSVGPPPQRRAVRDLPRTRVSRVQMGPQAKHRLYNRLADTHITLARVGSAVFGKSARRRREALVAGARDPAKRSARARGTGRGKIPPREGALEGPCTAPHAQRMTGALELGAVLGRQRAERAQPLQELLRERTPQLAQ
jgi:hypothetical protein